MLDLCDMTGGDMIDLLSDDFYEDYAATKARIVADNDAVGVLYEVAAGKVRPSLPPVKREQLYFRAAYVLEVIFFDYPELFAPYTERFFADFPDTGNNSAKRHFAKIMAHLLKKRKPGGEFCEKIAEACATWTTDSKIRVGVKVWAMEVLLLLKPDVDWIEELLPGILETLMRDPSPAAIAGWRRWKRAHI